MHIHIDKLALGTIPTVLVVAIVFGFGEKAGHYGFDWLVPPSETSHSSNKSIAHDVGSAPPIVPGAVTSVPPVVRSDPAVARPINVLPAPTEKDAAARNRSLDAALDAVEMKPVKGKIIKLSDTGWYDVGSGYPANVGTKKFTPAGPKIVPEKRSGTITDGYNTAGATTDGYNGSGAIIDGTYGTTVNLGGGYDFPNTGVSKLVPKKI
jgi:hypothetical protein